MFEKQLLAAFMNNEVNREFVRINAEKLQEFPNKYRKFFLKNPELAFSYAAYVDRHAREDTRTGSLSDPWWAYSYAILVDKKAMYVTWMNVKGSMYENSYRTHLIEKIGS